MKILKLFITLTLFVSVMFTFSCLHESLDESLEELETKLQSGANFKTATINTSNNYLLRGWNLHFVSSENGSKSMRCNRSHPQLWERFKFSSLGNSNYALLGNNNRYVCSENGSKSINCNRTNRGAWEKFLVDEVTTQNGFPIVTLKGNNGKYVSAEKNGNSMNCNRSSAAEWEKFELIEACGTLNFNFYSFDLETSWDNSDPKSSRAIDYNPNCVDGKGYLDQKSNGQYVFKCRSADGHRTELKEKLARGLYANRKMEYTAIVQNLPADGVTIAQVHNREVGNLEVNRPLLRVYIDDNKKIKVKVTTNSPDNTNGTYTTLPSSSGGIPYTSGAEIKLAIQIYNGKIYIDVSSSSSTTKLDLTVTPSSAWDDHKENYYLKAGVYTEGNNTEPKMTMSSFFYTDNSIM